MCAEMPCDNTNLTLTLSLPVYNKLFHDTSGNIKQVCQLKARLITLPKLVS